MVWISQGLGDIDSFLFEFKQRLKDCATQDWQSDISSTNKFNTYCTYKSLLVSEKYLVCISNINYKTALAKFRCSSHNLRIETGRRDKIENVKVCQKFGFYDVEDDYHFLFSCTLYANLRSTILGNITPNHQNFIRIMTTDNEQIINYKISKFVYCAFKLRKESLSSV